MDRYRSFGELDDPPINDGDTTFNGVNEYDAPEDLKPGEVQAAVNVDFSTGKAETRKGFVCLPVVANSSISGNWSYPTYPADYSFSGVAYGNGVYVVILDVGSVYPYVFTSPDATNWTQRSCPANDYYGIAFGNGTFVAVGSNGACMTSQDGVTWTARTIGTGYWQGVCFGNNRFVAVSLSGTNRVATSTDGITWTARSAAAQNEWTSVVFGNGQFVAVAASGTANRVMTSPDGATWTIRSTSGLDNFWYKVAYGNGRYVAVSRADVDATVMYSDDGVTWTGVNPTYTLSWRGLVFADGIFVAVAGLGTYRVMTSRDGVTWTFGTLASNTWNGLGYGAGTFIAVAQDGTGNRIATAYSGAVRASGIYSDPNDAGSQWIMVARTRSVGFYASGRQSRSVDYPSGETVLEPATIVQCNNQVYLFRGASEVPLYWDGNWNNDFQVVPETTPAPGFETIPYSNQATYYQNRLWVKNGKDQIAASDVLDFTTYDAIANDFNLNTGSSDYIVTTYPFGENSLVVFKNRSIILLQNVDGSLNDVTATEITRQVGCIGINAVVSVGPDMVYMSDRNINLVTLTSTNNSVQHKTLPLSKNIRTIFSRVNWNAASKVSMGYWDNKLYVAIPLDNSTTCNAVCVYNFIDDTWYGEWNFADGLGMAIQGWAVAPYLGIQRLHCITEDGRIFITDEGANDISGNIVEEISYSLTTRAYRANNDNRVGRRVWLDLSTWRPDFSVVAYVDGANEYEEVLSDQTYSRSESWIFNDSDYDLTNANDDFNRAGRKDYASGPNSIQPQSGFLPEMTQDYRLPLITRRKGRLHWFQITNTQGRIAIRTVGSEARAGDRSNLIQVI